MDVNRATAQPAAQARERQLPSRMEQDGPEVVGNVLKGFVLGGLGGTLAGSLLSASIIGAGRSLGWRAGLPLVEVAVAAGFLTAAAGLTAGPILGGTVFSPPRTTYTVTPDTIDLLRGEALREAGSRGLRASASASAISESIFDRYDRNADGMLVDGEGTGQTRSARALLDAADADADADGSVTRLELSGFISREYANEHHSLERLRVGDEVFEFDGFLRPAQLERFERDFGRAGEQPR